jgi:hypothetical protein
MTADATERDGTLHVTDSRTGRSYQVPITDGAVRARPRSQPTTSGCCPTTGRS